MWYLNWKSMLCIGSWETPFKYSVFKTTLYATLLQAFWFATVFVFLIQFIKKILFSDSPSSLDWYSGSGFIWPTFLQASIRRQEGQEVGESSRAVLPIIFTKRHILRLYKWDGDFVQLPGKQHPELVKHPDFVC